ncbi:COP9 signalosome complex subunit 6a [Striga hermonthica]|uniref:COP9 signalosome complex subunit 6a n=1 Tax=Striga hermonthica TaxID=68872 RepID=A0A9N7R7N8_STRHE|nr:COP9 signalosome complex subunit 6a [Striga hermonthica]
MSSSSSSGLTFKLHPLVIVNISDHYTRVKSQYLPPPDARNGGENSVVSLPSPPRVYECVIGVQRGRIVEIFNSFELIDHRKILISENHMEAERISVDHVAHLKPSDGGSAATQLAAHLTGIHSAIKMLNSRIRVLHHYLLAMQKGTMCILFLFFYGENIQEYNDTLLIMYLAMFTNCSSSFIELVDKFK